VYIADNSPGAQDMRLGFMRTLATGVVLSLVGPFVRDALADKIVVYGASGSVGKVIVEEALSRGHEVIGVSRNPESLKFDNARFTVPSPRRCGARTSS
jgi:NADPH-dependent curcumin reductase CurA